MVVLAVIAGLFTVIGAASPASARTAATTALDADGSGLLSVDQNTDFGGYVDASVPCPS